MATPIDEFAVAEALKKEIDAVHKQKKQDAEDYLAEMRDSIGTTSLEPTMFPGAGTYKYGQSRAKKEVEYNLCDKEDFDGWLATAKDATALFAASMPSEFGKWWFEMTGEIPDGISRVEVDIPPAATPPKFYKFDVQAVKDALGKNLFQAANQLLLGDGE